jgi:hypothetical protein
MDKEQQSRYGEVFKAVDNFLNTVEIRPFNRDLRKMVFRYLQADEDATGYEYWDDLCAGLDALFDFLDALAGDAEEMKRFLKIPIPS